MKQLTITIDDFLYDFYRKIGNNVGKTPEKTIEDALLRLAGELSMEAISKKGGTIRWGGCHCVKKRAVRLSFFFFIYALYGLYAAYVPRATRPLGMRMVSRISLSVSRRPRSALTPLCRIS